MAEKAWYKVDQETPTRWKVWKILESKPEDMFAYDVAMSGNYMVCSCFAGNKSTCRHRQMVDLFKKNAAIGTGAMYQWDKQLWREPSNPDEEEA